MEIWTHIAVILRVILLLQSLPFALAIEFVKTKIDPKFFLIFFNFFLDQRLKWMVQEWFMPQKNLRHRQK